MSSHSAPLRVVPRGPAHASDHAASVPSPWPSGQPDSARATWATASARAIASERRTTRAFETALEIEDRAAWLAWQICAGEATARGAVEQITAIADELERSGRDVPDDLRERLSQSLAMGRAAALESDMPAAEAAARNVRAMVESYRNAVFV